MYGGNSLLSVLEAVLFLSVMNSALPFVEAVWVLLQAILRFTAATLPFLDAGLILFATYGGDADEDMCGQSEGDVRGAAERGGKPAAARAVPQPARGLGVQPGHDPPPLANVRRACAYRVAM
eukprot:298927-Rhodomonas_salina.1